MLACITLAAALSAASVALPATVVAQTTTVPARPQPSPAGRAPGHGSGSHHGGSGNNRYGGPGVYVDARAYLTTPNPHKTPFRNTTHNTIPAGEDVFSSQSSK